MEKWCLEMGFKHDDIDQFCRQMKGHCQPQVKILWKHLTKHVLPKSEADIIRKQHLFNRLRTSKNDHKIEFSLRSVKEYNDYMKYKKDERILKNLQEDIEKKKSFIKDHLDKLELLRKSSIREEEELKEKAFKLNQLKNKKITITRFINKLMHDGKMLNELKEPRNIVGYGSNVTEWDLQVLLILKELPQGFERHTLLAKLYDLKAESKLDPVCYWDRTEVLTSIEKLLLSLNEKLKASQLALTDEKYKTEKSVELLVPHIIEKCEGVITVDDAVSAFEKCKEDLLHESDKIFEKLSTHDKPYILEVQYSTARRLYRLIDERVEDVNSLLDIECGGLADAGSPCEPPADLPSQLPVHRLLNSLDNEVSVFMKMCLCDTNSQEVNFQQILSGCSSESEYLSLKENSKKLLELLNFLDKVSSLKMSCTGIKSVPELKECANEPLTNMPQLLESCKELIAKVNSGYQRLKAGFVFWRQEPLNERLTGIEVNEVDIKSWLASYAKVKEALDHEKWISSEYQKP